jgi:hypothetical protein
MGDIEKTTNMAVPISLSGVKVKQLLKQLIDGKRKHHIPMEQLHQLQNITNSSFLLEFLCNSDTGTDLVDICASVVNGVVCMASKKNDLVVSGNQQFCSQCSTKRAVTVTENTDFPIDQTTPFVRDVFEDSSTFVHKRFFLTDNSGNSVSTYPGNRKRRKKNRQSRRVDNLSARINTFNAKWEQKEQELDRIRRRLANYTTDQAQVVTDHRRVEELRHVWCDHFSPSAVGHSVRRFKKFHTLRDRIRNETSDVYVCMYVGLLESGDGIWPSAFFSLVGITSFPDNPKSSEVDIIHHFGKTWTKLRLFFRDKSVAVTLRVPALVSSCVSRIIRSFLPVSVQGVYTKTCGYLLSVIGTGTCSYLVDGTSQVNETRIRHAKKKTSPHRHRSNTYRFYVRVFIIPALLCIKLAEHKLSWPIDALATFKEVVQHIDGMINIQVEYRYLIRQYPEVHKLLLSEGFDILGTRKRRQSQSHCDIRKE